MQGKAGVQQCELHTNSKDAQDAGLMRKHGTAFEREAALTFLMCFSLLYASDRAALLRMPLVSMPTVAPGPVGASAEATSLSDALRFMPLG